jgi:hypothetical protein
MKNIINWFCLLRISNYEIESLSKHANESKTSVGFGFNILKQKCSNIDFVQNPVILRVTSFVFKTLEVKFQNIEDSLPMTNIQLSLTRT